MKNTYNSYLFSLVLIIVPVKKDKRETDNHVKVQKMSLSNILLSLQASDNTILNIFACHAPVCMHGGKTIKCKLYLWLLEYDKRALPI